MERSRGVVHRSRGVSLSVSVATQEVKSVEYRIVLLVFRFYRSPFRFHRLLQIMHSQAQEYHRIPVINQQDIPVVPQCILKVVCERAVVGVGHHRLQIILVALVLQLWHLGEGHPCYLGDVEEHVPQNIGSRRVGADFPNVIEGVLAPASSKVHDTSEKSQGSLPVLAYPLGFLLEERLRRIQELLQLFEITHVDELLAALDGAGKQLGLGQDGVLDRGPGPRDLRSISALLGVLPLLPPLLLVLLVSNSRVPQEQEQGRHDLHVPLLPVVPQVVPSLLGVLLKQLLLHGDNIPLHLQRGSLLQVLQNFHHVLLLAVLVQKVAQHQRDQQVVQGVGWHPTHDLPEVDGRLLKLTNSLLALGHFAVQGRLVKSLDPLELLVKGEGGPRVVAEVEAIGDLDEGLRHVGPALLLEGPEVLLGARLVAQLECSDSCIGVQLQDDGLGLRCVIPRQAIFRVRQGLLVISLLNVHVRDGEG
mmetsp:Transcript_8087/g.23124  ORF Transcript_8087/g.23124 Transcript_8087/m.23124 type:complete len:475 (-) Transcript_8087:960-2384(-)